MKLKHNMYIAFTINPNTILAKKYCDEDTVFFISSNLRKTDILYIFLRFLGDKCDVTNASSFEFNLYDFYMDYTVKKCLAGAVTSDLISSGLKLYNNLLVVYIITENKTMFYIYGIYNNNIIIHVFSFTLCLTFPFSFVY